PLRATCCADEQSPTPWQPGRLPSVRGLPPDAAAIVATPCQSPPVRPPRHTTARGWPPTAHPPVGACAHLPHLHLLLIAPTGQKPAIWTPLHAEEGGVDVVGVAQGLHTGFCGRVPQLDGIAQPP